MSTRAVLSAAALCVVTLMTSCSPDGGAMKVVGGPRPNGVADMKPARAMVVAQQAMNELHDAVYESAVTIEIEGVARRFKVVETVTADGCARETSHPRFGRIWVRVIGRTMWMKANDRAGDAIGRTPAQIEILRGRWLKGPAPELVEGCNLGYLMPTRRDGGLMKATGKTKVAGRPGRRFHVTGGGVSVTVVIATTGAPLMISSRNAAEPGALGELPAGMSFDGKAVLTDTDTGAEVEPPPPRLVIDPADFHTAPA